MSFKPMLEALTEAEILEVTVHTVPKMLDVHTIALPMTIKYIDDHEVLSAEVGIGITRHNIESSINDIVLKKHIPRSLVQFVTNEVTGRTMTYNVNNFDLENYLANTELNNFPELGVLKERSEIFTSLLNRDRMLLTYISTVFFPDWEEMFKGLMSYHYISGCAKILKNDKGLRAKHMNPLPADMYHSMKDGESIDNIGHRHTVFNTLMKEFRTESNISPHGLAARLRLADCNIELTNNLFKSLSLIEFGSKVLEYQSAEFLPESFIHLFYHSLFSK